MNFIEIGTLKDVYGCGGATLAFCSREQRETLLRLEQRGLIEFRRKLIFKVATITQRGKDKIAVYLA